MSRSYMPYLFVAPILLLMAAFTYYPIWMSFDLSFRSWDFLSDAKPYVGLQNYKTLLASSEFTNAVKITVLFVVFSVPVRLVLALLIASYLIREDRISRFMRGAFFLPTVTSSVAIAVIFSWFFSTDIGMANAILSWFGIPQQQWLQQPSLALIVLIVVNTWKQIGYDIVIYIAGLQAIPRDLYEATAIDGASRWKTFRFITLPLLMPTTYFLLVVSVIEAFQVFTIVDVMTEGGPAGGTDMLVYILYRIGFTLFDIGQGSALAVMLFILLVVITVIKSRFLGKRVHYEA